MDNKISIIVAVFNIEKFIERCILSLLAQTYPNIEILLIDDGSTDRSGVICRKYEEKDKRIKYYYKPNGGLSDARNYGIAAATGEWITFVDGDDFIYSGMYQELLEAVLKNHLKLGMCSFQTFYREEDLDFRRAKRGDKKILARQEVLDMLHSPQRTDVVISCCKLFHRELFADFAFPIGRYREDEFSTYKFWFQVEHVYYTGQKMYFYFQREDSILHKENIKKETDYWDALLERNEYFKRKCLPADFQQRDVEFCMRQLYNAFFLKNCDQKIKRYYIHRYKRQYDCCAKKSIDKYFVARYFTGAFILLWNIKRKS